MHSRTAENEDDILPPSDPRTGENTGIYAKEHMQVHKIRTESNEE